MKLKILFPATYRRKLTEVNDELKLCAFYEPRKATEVSADALHGEKKGCVVQIRGGNGKLVFP